MINTLHVVIQFVCRDNIETLNYIDTHSLCTILIGTALHSKHSNRKSIIVWYV